MERSRDSKGRFLPTNNMPFAQLLESISSDDSAKVTIGIGAVVSIILAGGFLNGIYAHILLTTGYDISSNETILLSVFNVTCNTLGTLPNSQQSDSLCNQTYSAAKSEVNLEGFIYYVLPILVLALAIAFLFGKMGDGSSMYLIAGLFVGVLIGLILHTTGYFVGFSLMGGYSTINATTSAHHITSTIINITTTSTTSTTTIPTYSGVCNVISPNGKPTFQCSGPFELVNKNTISFNLTMLGPDTVSNITLGCNWLQKPVGSMGYYGLLPNGSVDQNFNGTQLSHNQTIYVKNLTCESLNPSGASEGGYLFINYTYNSTRFSEIEQFHFG